MEVSEHCPAQQLGGRSRWLFHGAKCGWRVTQCFCGLCLWRHTGPFALSVRARVASAEIKASSFSVPQKFMYLNCKSYSFVIAFEIANPGVQTPSVWLQLAEVISSWLEAPITCRAGTCGVSLGRGMFSEGWDNTHLIMSIKNQNQHGSELFGRLWD